MSLSAERSAKNAPHFRAANELLERRRIELLGDGDDQATPFLYESDQMSCTAVVC